MTDNDRSRASILAVVDEIVERHRAFSIPIDENDFCEAWATILRIEEQMLHLGQGVLD